MAHPIKQKFIDHMELYQLSKQTQKGYISGVRCLAKHYNTSPEHHSNDQVREYFRHLHDKKNCIELIRTFIGATNVYAKKLVENVQEMIRSIEKSVRKNQFLLELSRYLLFKGDSESIISNPKSHTILLAQSSQL